MHHRSASPRPGYGGSIGSPRLGARERAVAQLQGDESPALNFLARRGSEALHSSDTDDSFDREVAMANAERELKADAEWKRIQQNTFTRWANEHLKTVDKAIDDLATDFSDGLKLIALIEVLANKKMPKHNKRPNFRSQKLENVSIALEFLEREGITLVNIDSTDIVDCKLKLILGLIWTLILHYAISMPMWDGPPLGGGGAAAEKTPKQRLMDWVKDKVPMLNNFTTDFNDGKAIGALVDNVAPGLCPDWENWDPKRPVENAREAMDLADKWLNVPKLLEPEEIVNPNVDEQSMMTYLSQFPHAKLKPGAPLRKKTDATKVRAYGPGLEPKGLVAKAPANFTVETFGAGDGELAVKVVQQESGKELECEIVFNNDRKATYSCSYFPEEEGDYVVSITWSNREIPDSPYNVNVEGFAGDASKVTASGPGLLPEGVIINRPTHFDIFAQGAGKGSPDVIILDPKGKKDSVPIQISPHPSEADTYKCEYVATLLGLHSVNVFFAGNPIPLSPFGVRVSPASIPTKVWANGRGLQPTGIRVNETVDFKVYTEGAGEGKVGVKIIGPGGIDLDYISRSIDATTTEFTYTPKRDGRHIIMITFANVEIPRSPFEVTIGKHKVSKIKAYGPGLKGGIVSKPAKFTVDTCGETGALGFSIQGPSQAKINCKDNGDGSAEVEYIPTAEGEYAVHILCDKEDIPGSPYMAQIVPATDYDPDKVRVFGPGVENGVNPKEETHFTVDISDAGSSAPLEIYLVDDLGQFEPRISKVSETVFECFYTPRAKQHKQTVFVNFGGVAVPGSPFRVLNDNPNDPSLVEVYGPGIEPGVRAGCPVEFTVDCSKSGPGDVTVNITSAKRKTVPVSITDNGDDTYTVTYEAQIAGPQSIVIALDDTEVPQSPIKLDIKPAVDLTKIKLIDFEPEAFVDCPNDFVVDTSELPSNLKSQVQCDISGPDGNPVEADVSKLGPDGPFQVSYIPTEEGDHEVDLRYDGTPLPDSPFPVTAVRGCNPQKVKAYGDGLERGIVDQVNTFTIETRNAGTGGLGIAVEGPSEAEMNCTDNKDGTCTVEYVPVEEGDYDIAIKFDDEHIPGSPFQVPVTTIDGKPKVDPRKVKAYGPGLEPESIFPGKPTSFTVDASDTGDAPLEVIIGDGQSDDNNDDDNADLGKTRRGSRLDGSDARKGSKSGQGARKDIDNDQRGLGSRKASELLTDDEEDDGFGIGNKEGKGLAALRARGDSLSRRGSSDALGANKDDLNESGKRGRDDKAGKKSGKMSSAGGRKGSSSDRKKAFSQPVIMDKGDGTHEVSYVPPPVGDPYEIAVRYAGVDIPGSPFLMTCNPNMEDVVSAAISDGLGSRKGSSAISPERSYSKNGTGLQRQSIAEEGKGPRDVSELIRNALPGALDGKKDDNDDDNDGSLGGKYNRSGTDGDPSRRKGSGGSLGDSSGASRKSSSESSGLGSRKSSSQDTPYGRNLGSRQASRDLLGQEGGAGRRSSGLGDDGSADQGLKSGNSADGRNQGKGQGSRDGRKGSGDDADIFGRKKSSEDASRKGSASLAGSRLGEDKSRKGSEDGSRKGSKFGDSDPYGRKGSSAHDDDDFGLSDSDGARRGSNLGGREQNRAGDSGSNRRGSELDDASGRRTSRLGSSDPNRSKLHADDINSGKDSSYDPSGANNRKGSRDNLDEDSDIGPDGRRDSRFGQDGSEGRMGSDDLTRRGSKLDPNNRKDSLASSADASSRKASRADDGNYNISGTGQHDPTGLADSNDPNLAKKSSLNELHSRKGSKMDPNDNSNRRGSGLDSSDPNFRRGSHLDPNDPNSRRGSGLDDPNRTGSVLDSNDPSSRRGSGLGPNDPSYRKGSGYDPNDPDARKPSGYDPSDANTRKPSGYDPNDPDGRKLSGVDPNDPFNRRGSGLGPNDPSHRKGSGYDQNDPNRRKLSGENQNDPSYRRGSGLGTDDPNYRKGSSSDPNDPSNRRGSGYGSEDPNYRKGSSSDPNDPSNRRGSGYGSEDPNFRKGSSLDPNGPSRGRGPGVDTDDPHCRKGSNFDPSDPNGRRSSGYDPNNRKGSGLDSDDPNYRKRSSYNPNDPDGGRGTGFDPNDPHNRKGSGLDSDDPSYRKGSSYDPNDPHGRKGSGFDPNDPNSRRGSGLDSDDPNYRRGSNYDPNDPSRRRGSGYGSNDPNNRRGSGLDSDDPTHRKGSSYDPNDANRRRGSGYDTNDINTRRGSGIESNDELSSRKGSKDSSTRRGSRLDQNDPRQRRGSALESDDSNYRKGSGHDSGDPTHRKGLDSDDPNYRKRLASDDDPLNKKGLDPTNSSYRRGSGLDSSDPNHRPGSSLDANDPNYRPGSRLDSDDPSFRKGSGDYHSKRGSGLDDNDPASRRDSRFDPNDPKSSRRGSGRDSNDLGSRKGSGYDPSDPSYRRGSGLDSNYPGHRKVSSLDPDDPSYRRGSEFEPNDPYARFDDHKNRKGSHLGSNANARSRGSDKDFDPNHPQSRYDPDDPHSGSQQKRLEQDPNGRSRYGPGDSLLDDPLRRGSAFDAEDEHSRRGSQAYDDTSRKGSKDKYGSRKGSNLDSIHGDDQRKDSSGKSYPGLDSYPYGRSRTGSKDPLDSADNQDSRHRKGGRRGPGSHGLRDSSSDDSADDLNDNGRRGGSSRHGGRRGSHDKSRKGSSDAYGRKGLDDINGNYGKNGNNLHPVELSNIPIPSTGGNVTAQVRTPSNAMHLPHVEDNGNGSVGVFYQPTEQGAHNLDVRYNGEHVQGSPYKFFASPNDEGKVYAYGPGLTHGVCGDPANFVISTKGAGAGGLALAVEGPSKADINCIDNKDGTVNVSYLPTAPGEYKISARFADQHIEGSPFTCKVTGEGKKRNAISVGSASELSLPENISDYDLRSLNAYIVSPMGSEEPCFLKKLPKGNTGISFTPREVGEHLVSVKRNGKHITNSPFKIMVNPEDVGDASRVKVSGSALREGKTHEDNLFTVDTKNAGYGGLSLSVEGPSKAEIKCKDNEDGTLDVSYKPSEPGLYIVNLKFADQHAPGSPFAVAVSGQGTERQTEKINRMREAVPVTEVGSQCRLTFKMPGIKPTDLKASVTSPTGKVETAIVVELEDGLYAVNFVPYELGVHTVSVMYKEVDIPGSPFQFTVGPLQDGGAHRVHAGGPGLERGVQGKPADFNVWTREAGYGSLAIAVEGPSKAEVEFKDRKDGSCHVSYVVEEPGEYTVGIRFNDTHIPGSPYKVYILPSADDAERVRMSNMADGPVNLDIPQTMLLNMNGADGDVECKIVAPSGREDDCFITPLGDGEHTVRFVPKEEGIHHLHARLNGIHIPGSPFKLEVRGALLLSDDPSSVAVRGLGIERGTTGRSSKFTIDTSGVGAGTLSITVDGPSKVDLSCNEVEDGYEVAYTPMAPGKYYVTVKYNGKNVRGSPFSVMVGGESLLVSNNRAISQLQKEQSRSSSMTMETMQRTSYIRHQCSEQRVSSMSLSKSGGARNQILPPPPKKSLESDSTKVKVLGKGLEQALISRQNSFTVDCGRAGNNVLYVGVYGPDVPCDEVVIRHQGDKRYSVNYVVHEKGEYIIFVKWGDEHIPGSPFRVVA